MGPPAAWIFTGWPFCIIIISMDTGAPYTQDNFTMLEGKVALITGAGRGIGRSGNFDDRDHSRHQRISSKFGK